MIKRVAHDEDEVVELIAGMLRRPRVLKRQTSRHLDEYIETGETSLHDFLRDAAHDLEDYQLEIIFAPVFTPSFEEQLELADCLTRFRPSASDIETIVEKLAKSCETCPIKLPDSGDAPLTLHEVLIERYVRLLRLNDAPAQEAVDSLRAALSAENAARALTLMRRKGFTPDHQDWFSRFVTFMADRRSIEAELLESVSDFVTAQRSFEVEALRHSAESLLNAAIEAGNFVQKGRMYWSSDVAEHHHFRGQGVVDGKEVEKRMKDVRHLEAIREDLEAFVDVLPIDSGGC